MREVRKWEDLEFDCLVNILGRVGIESLLLDVPFVCKSWHRASFNPLCWQHIDIPLELIYDRGSYTPFVRRFINEYNDIDNFSVGGFICLLFARGISKSASRVLTGMCDDKDLQYVAEKCPQLKSLKLHWYVIVHYGNVITKVIGKLKQLDEIEIDIEYPAGMGAEMLALIAHNCRNFNSLIIGNGILFDDDSLAIATHLPKIKKLSIERCEIAQEFLEIILGSCKDLEYLNVSRCNVTDDWNEKKVKELASHVKTLSLDVH